MNKITQTLSSFLFLFALALAPACDDGSDSGDLDDGAETDTGDLDETRGLTLPVRVKQPDLRIPIGGRWGACDLTGVDQPGWWGCDGALGVGLACARPVSDDGLNICVPQTADPAIDNDCGNVDAPFGLGVSTIGNGTAYCGVDCVSAADCANGMLCSPASHICAWIGN
jgi:hypothetical protein